MCPTTHIAEISTTIRIVLIRIIASGILLVAMSNCFFAQSVLWQYPGGSGSHSLALTELSNGNLLQLVENRFANTILYEFDPQGELLSTAFCNDCNGLFHLQEVGNDSIFAIRDDGQCFLATEQFTVFADLGNAFPALVAEAPLDGMKVLGRDYGEIVARAWGAFDGQYEARIRYNDSLEIINRVRDWEDIFIAYGPDEEEARLVTDFPQWHLVVPGVTTADSVIFSFSYDDTFTDMFYTPDGNLHMTGYVDTSFPLSPFDH